VSEVARTEGEGQLLPEAEVLTVASDGVAHEEASVYVSVTKTKGPLDQPLQIATIAGEVMLTWLREIDGFEGLLMLTNETAATTLTLTFWKDRDVAERHRVARMEFRDRITSAVDVNVEETLDYEVSFVDLGPRLAELHVQAGSAALSVG
jgi:hypothetical protein